MSDPAHTSKRPLSPHLQIYKPQMTSVLSILHRACGAALAIGLLLVAAVLIAAGMGEDEYNQVMGLVNTKLGTLALFGWSVALFYHMSNGVRHLIWDTGRMLNIKHAYIGGYLVLLSTAVLVYLTWEQVFFVIPFTEYYFGK